MSISLPVEEPFPPDAQRQLPAVPSLSAHPARIPVYCHLHKHWSLLTLLFLLRDWLREVPVPVLPYLPHRSFHIGPVPV